MAQSVEVGSAKSIDEKIALITRNLDEVMGGEKAIAELRSILEKRDLRIYWGTAPTGKPHIAYFVAMSKLADFLRAGCEVTILFANLHAYLDNQKAPWELLQKRSDYYEHIIKAMLGSINVPIDKLKFVRGTDFQLSQDYTLDMYRLTAMTTERNAKKAGAEVVKQVESPLLAGILYPLLQALDEKYLNCDAQFGGVDQRKIFAYAETYLPRIGEKKRVHLMNPMVPSLTGGKGNKMSSSDPNSKIDLLDPADVVKSKIMKAFAEEGKTEGNGLLAFTRHVLFPLYGTKGLTIEREEKFGGNLHFNSYEELDKSYADKSLFPLDLKIQVAKAINGLLDPIRAQMATPEMLKLIAEAYPAVVPEEAPVVEDADEEPEPKAAEANTSAAAGTPDMTQDFYKLDLRVASLENVRDHPGADSLFLLDCNVGTELHLPVVTNLKSTMAAAQLEKKPQVMLMNLKPTSFRGEKSLAMIFGGNGGADGTTHGLVEPLEQTGFKTGDRLFLAGQGPVQGDIARANEKVIAKVFGEFSTDEQGNLMYNGKHVVTGNGIKVGMPGVPNGKFSAK